MEQARIVHTLIQQMDASTDEPTVTSRGNEILALAKMLADTPICG